MPGTGPAHSSARPDALPRRIRRAPPPHGARIPMNHLEPMARDLGALLKARGETVAVSESSTGGLVSAALLAIPGASAYFVGGAVTYTGTARHGLIALPRELPPETRSSSEPYATLAARTIRQHLGIDVGACGDGGGGTDRQPLRRRGGAHLPRGRRAGRAGPHPRDWPRQSRSQHVGIRASRPRPPPRDADPGLSRPGRTRPDRTDRTDRTQRPAPARTGAPYRPWAGSPTTPPQRARPRCGQEDAGSAADLRSPSSTSQKAK